MPRLHNMLAESGTVTIPVEGDEPLVVRFRRGVLTPRLQARMAQFEREAGSPGSDALDLFCDVISRVIESWNLTDESGQPIGTDAEAIKDLQIEVIKLVMSEVGKAMNPDPLKDSVSSNGSSPTAGLEPLPITTGS